MSDCINSFSSNLVSSPHPKRSLTLVLPANDVSEAWGETCQGGTPLLPTPYYPPSRTIWTTGNGLITLEAQKRDGK